MQQGRLTYKFLRNFKKDFRRTINELIEKYGDKFYLKGLGRRIHFITDPKLIENILFTNSKDFPRPPNPIFDAVENPTHLPQDAIHERWKKFRTTLLNPLMAEASVKQLTNIVVAGTEKKLDSWGTFTESGEPFPLYSHLEALTLNNLINGILGKVDLDRPRVIHMLDELATLEIAYELSLTKIPWKLPTTIRRRTKKVTKDLLATSDIIVKHCLSDEVPVVLFKDIVKSYGVDYHDAHLDPAIWHFLRNIACLYMIAGFDSISRALPPIFSYLSLFPHVAEEIRAEVDKLGGPITMENVDSLIYTRAAFLEGLRYSGGIFPMLTRRAAHDLKFGDYEFKAKDTVLIPIFNMLQRSPYWENPQGFDPTRFLNVDLLDERRRFTYLAFGAGLHGCAGRNFAILQCTIIIAMLTQKYRMDLIPFYHMNFDFPTTVRMQLYKREG
jgi:enediyne biosynthesis protein E7